MKEVIMLLFWGLPFFVSIAIPSEWAEPHQWKTITVLFGLGFWVASMRCMLLKHVEKRINDMEQSA